MQIVEIRFRVKVIPSVPEGIHYTDTADIGQDGAVVPRRSRIASVAVACNLGAARVVDRNDIAEKVFFEEVEFNIYIRIKDR